MYRAPLLCICTVHLYCAPAYLIYPHTQLPSLEWGGNTPYGLPASLTQSVTLAVLTRYAPQRSDEPFNLLLLQCSCLSSSAPHGLKFAQCCNKIIFQLFMLLLPYNKILIVCGNGGGGPVAVRLRQAQVGDGLPMPGRSGQGGGQRGERGDAWSVGEVVADWLAATAT